MPYFIMINDSINAFLTEIYYKYCLVVDIENILVIVEVYLKNANKGDIKMKPLTKNYYKLAIIAASLIFGNSLLTAAYRYVDFESGGYSLDGDGAGTAVLSEDQALSPTHSAQLSLANTVTDFAKVIIDFAPGSLSLKEAAGTFYSYISSGNPAYLPYMYFGVDTNGDQTFNFGDDSFVIAFITDGPAVQFDTWQISGIDGGTDVHVVGARPGLGSSYSTASTVDTLSSLSGFSTGSGLWGDLGVLEVRVGAGETGSDYGAYTSYVDDITVVPEPSLYAVLCGIAVIGFVVWRRRSE